MGKVLAIWDHLKKKSGGYDALVRVIQRPVPSGSRATAQEIADHIMEGLWCEGWILSRVHQDKEES